MALLPDAPSPSRQPMLHNPVRPESVERAAVPMTEVQQEILTALEGGTATHVHDRPETSSPAFWRGGLIMLGLGSLAAGAVTVFFFTIFGAALLFLGSAACVYALQTEDAIAADD